MRLFISTAAALVLCVCALVACSPQDGSAPAAKGATTASGNNAPAQKAKQPEAQHSDDTRRISIEETQKAVDAGTALVVDVRDESSYKTSHIKGAKSIPLAQFDERMGELPKDKLIITYCA
ncbi:MAG TPA: rhodanese-like domain-containing protein [Pyrinomonadaceae bacterium]|jgi:3-mercaptopyruvate sulfurtransferase SseA|nr:rhodanese-like domain-containing protein [Pyrinomonadaceae bacterium]